MVKGNNFGKFCREKKHTAKRERKHTMQPKGQEKNIYSFLKHDKQNE